MKIFIVKAINLIAVIAIVITYQSFALEREKKIETYNEKKAEAQQLAIEYSNEPAAAEIFFNDGTYQGSGTGFGGLIMVNVCISDGKITEIEITSHENEDKAYFDQAVGITDKIIKAQSTDVDTISGATYSSKGIREAVYHALKEAA